MNNQSYLPIDKRIVNIRSFNNDNDDDDDDDTDSFMIGDRVWVQGIKPGYIVYIGDVKFAKGVWAGIVLDRPEGKNDGSVNGVRYFQCQPKQGLFTRLHRLTRYPIDVVDINNNPIIHNIDDDVVGVGDNNNLYDIKQHQPQQQQQQQQPKTITTTTTTTTTTSTSALTKSSRSTSSLRQQTQIEPSPSTSTTVRTQRLCSTDGKITTTITRITKSPIHIPHYMLPIKPTKVITTITTTTTTMDNNNRCKQKQKLPKSVLKTRQISNDDNNDIRSTINKHHVHF